MTTIESLQQENSNLKRDLSNAFMESESRRKRIVELEGVVASLRYKLDEANNKIGITLGTREFILNERDTLRARVAELEGELEREQQDHQALVDEAQRVEGVRLATIKELEAACAGMRERLTELLQVADFIDDETKHQTRAIEASLANEAGKALLDLNKKLEARCDEALNLLCVAENLLVRTQGEIDDDWRKERDATLVRIDEFIELETSKKSPCCPRPPGDLKALANAIDYPQCYTNNETMTAPRKIADLQQAAQALRCMADKDSTIKELLEVLVVAGETLKAIIRHEHVSPALSCPCLHEAQDATAHIDKVLGGVQ